MSIQQLIISELADQPEPMLREVLHYLSFLKAQSGRETGAAKAGLRRGFGSVPGILLADDFDAPLPDFADYRP